MSTPEIKLPAPESGRIDILFVAGEHSGDQHAALLADDLLKAHPDWKLAAMGGPSLKHAGVQLLYDLTRQSVVGLVEVLRHYGTFKRIFNALLCWVSEYRPKVVVLVDYPGFNLRFAEALRKAGISRKGGGDVALYQYVSPQIWAWKAKRRFKMARILDEIGVIFPFEVDCYQDTDLPVFFVGHPFVRDGYVNPLTYDPAGPILLLPGSRRQAVSRIFPAMLEAVNVYLDGGGKRSFVCLYPEEEIQVLLNPCLSSHPASLQERVSLRPVGEGASASGVLTSSGTMSLNCALAGLPGAIVYRAHPLTAWIGGKLISVEWLGIANLVLDETLYPEYLQKDAVPAVLAEVLRRIEENPRAAERFAEGALRLRERLTTERSVTVAQRLEDLAGKRL